MSKHSTPPDKGTATKRDDGLSIDRIHKILSNSRRRAVLDVILERGSVTKSALTDAVAAAEYDKPRAQINSQERKRVHVSLHQCHIPSLLDAGVLEKQNRELCAGPNARRVNNFRHDSRTGALARVRQAVRR